MRRRVRLAARVVRDSVIYAGHGERIRLTFPGEKKKKKKKKKKTLAEENYNSLKCLGNPALQQYDQAKKKNSFSRRNNMGRINGFHKSAPGNSLY